MLLALDIGNSAVKVGLFDGDEPEEVDSINLPDAASAASGSVHWREALMPVVDRAPIEQIGLVSVVPARTKAVAEALRTLTEAPMTLVDPKLALPFDLAYTTPDTLGNDRLAAATAGWMQYGHDAARSVLVVDAGTAVNYEVIHRDGIYQGGAIAAGPTLVREALRAGTAQLPDVPLRLPEAPVGRSTQTALQSGIMWGLVESVRGMRTRLAQSLPDSPRLILTGGWSALLVDHLDDEVHHVPHLVLQGVRLLTIQNA